MIIVIDTNIWLAELGLNSHAGTALRFFMRQQKARLAVPEVVRLEVQRHIRADLHERPRRFFLAALPVDHSVPSRARSYTAGSRSSVSGGTWK
jgi:predicted nucleic acid-binding protein